MGRLVSFVILLQLFSWPISAYSQYGSMNPFDITGGGSKFGQLPADPLSLRGFDESRFYPGEPSDAGSKTEARVLEEEGPSKFEEYVRGKSSPIISTNLKRFGQNLFEQPIRGYAPVTSVPIGPDYVLGPGDELRVTLWGKINAHYRVLINREGGVRLPQIGLAYLTGMTFSEARDFLETEFGRYYKRKEVNINLGMGRLRSIQIFVVGQARRPGSYTVSSLSTLINALFIASGPSKTGTMRDIQLKRNGKTLVHFDLYDFLLKGDKTNDVRLMPGDVIFIPPVGPEVGIAGHVQNPAIYELKSEIRLLDLINLSGGITALAFNKRIQVQRIENNESRNLFTTNLAGIDEASIDNFILKDGDLIKIFSVQQSTDWNLYRTVSIIGAVRNPGEYIVEKGERLSSLIELAGGFLETAYLRGSVFSRISVQKLQQTQINESIDRFEQQLISTAAVTIETAISPESALQEEAASQQRQQLIAKLRAAKPKGRIALKIESFEEFKGSAFDIILEEGDVLVIPERPQHVQVIGAVYHQTAFIHTENQRVRDFIKMAGGVTDFADEKEMYILRVDGTAQAMRTSTGMFGNRFMKLKLNPGDTIVVPEKIGEIAWLRETKDLVQILFQIATTTALVLVLI